MVHLVCCQQKEWKTFPRPDTHASISDVITLLSFGHSGGRLLTGIGIEQRCDQCHFVKNRVIVDWKEEAIVNSARNIGDGQAKYLSNLIGSQRSSWIACQCGAHQWQIENPNYPHLLVIPYNSDVVVDPFFRPDLAEEVYVLSAMASRILHTKKMGRVFRMGISRWTMDTIGSTAEGDRSIASIISSK